MWQCPVYIGEEIIQNEAKRGIAKGSIGSIPVLSVHCQKSFF
jgi:hypothetical protein